MFTFILGFLLCALLAGMSAEGGHLYLGASFLAIAIFCLAGVLLKYLDSGAKFQDVDIRRREGKG